MHGDSNMQDTTRNLALNALQLIEDTAATSLLHSATISLHIVNRTSDLILHNESDASNLKHFVAPNNDVEPRGHGEQTERETFPPPPPPDARKVPG